MFEIRFGKAPLLWPIPGRASPARPHPPMATDCLRIMEYPVNHQLYRMVKENKCLLTTY